MIYLTEQKIYTPMEAIDYFSGKISDANIDTLVTHLTKELGDRIISVTEQEGVLFINVGTGDFISVSKK